MNYINAFIFAGIICAIGQIILDNTKFTPGHITSLFTVAGSILALFDIYPKLITKFGSGAVSVISNFGNMLYQGGLQGFKESGYLGIFTGLLSKASAALVCAIVIAFLLSIIFKPKS